MKKTILLAACLFGMTAHSQSVEDYPELKGFLAHLGEIASYGGSQEYFGYTEAGISHNNPTCIIGPASYAQEWFEENAASILSIEEDMLSPGESMTYTQEQITGFTAQFVELLGGVENTVLSCRKSTSAAWTLSIFQSFEADGYKITFESGYED